MRRSVSAEKCRAPAAVRELVLAHARASTPSNGAFHINAARPAMIRLNRIAVIGALVFCARIFGANAPATPPAEPAMIVNFTENVPGVYGYGTWQNAFGVVAKGGFRIQGSKGAQGNGGFCKTMEPAIDLSHAKYIEVALAVQEGNDVPEYNVCFRDGDGTSCSARLRVAQLMPGQPVWLRLKLGDFAPSTRDPGKDGKMDWTKVDQWHLQGDWSQNRTAQILFIAVRART